MEFIWLLRFVGKHKHCGSGENESGLFIKGSLGETR